VVAATVLQVNDKFITLDEVLRPIRRRLSTLAAGSNEQAFRPRALELIQTEVRNQVEQTVLVAEAEKELTDEQKDAIQEEVKKRLGEAVAVAGSRAHFSEQLRSEGTDLPAWQENTRRVLMVNTCLYRRFGARVQVTRGTMWDYYKAHAEEFRTGEQAQMQIISAPLKKFLPADRQPTGADHQAARRQAKEHIEKAAAALAGGEDFAEVARRFSRGPMAGSGGVWAMMERGSFRAAAVEKVAFEQKLGHVSSVIETPLGFYIVKTIDRRPGGELPFEKVQAEIEEKLRWEQYRKLRREYLDDLRAKTTIRAADQFERLAVDAAAHMFFPQP
jgi:peptidyl-prolyl cis-trans isomerase SurA